MKLSVIIVNYNVKHFLEQCLHSVFSAIGSIDAEVTVVDNNSVDGSCALVKDKFPTVKLITNKKNYGFSYANNQAIKQAQGEYILLLNPDTVVQENTFTAVIGFMDSHSDAGGLGVKMIDGKGRFLPESKRGLPTPAVAFYKIFGLSKLFPKSERFGRYHLSNLDKEKIHKVDVLSGAFMLLRHSVLKTIGLLDEDYFMYGEDIDLSYRITKAGYNNYYFPETTIIHYKGESTKKGSINYVMVFYKAMIIFARKHFNRKNARMFSFLINMAIYFRAFLAIAHRFLLRLVAPALDAILIFAGYYFLTPQWSLLKFGEIDYYPPEFFHYAVPAYIITWLITLLFTGGYDRPLRVINIFKGLAIGSVIILLYYSLLPEHLRFSRALILLGTAYAAIAIPLMRALLHFTGIRAFRIDMQKLKKVVIAGNKEEIVRVSALLNQTGLNNQVVGFVSTMQTETNGFFMGSIAQIDEIVRIYKINEVIFCAKDFPSQQIIKYMLLLAEQKIDYKIAGPDGVTVIGSNSVHTAGDIYSINLNSIGSPKNKRKKRLFDVAMSIAIALIAPILLFLVKSPMRLLKNLIFCFFGLKSFVGYYKNAGVAGLPYLKPGILKPLDPGVETVSQQTAESANILYARDYNVLRDFRIIIRSLNKLDREA
ncbi:MAG: glycosyltransferase [Bacteroidales bacterium]|nr:glycosyltransferase [Bacteroidales bacterium]HOY37884.1 glycosyltransferase [Bacteroidales bacterium]HQP03841.1 glycosyltransferase [Bacteroidales bacterium]